jgi:hypothetical protein
VELSSKSEKFAMLTRLLVALSLILASIVFLTGAWPGSNASAPHPAEGSFVPKAVPLDASIIGSGLNAQQLLGKALEAVSTARASWLKTNVRQTVSGFRSDFIATGHLQRGPNNCARLEMSIVTSGEPSRLCIVSDGEVVAEARQLGSRQPAVAVTRLSADEPGARSAVLAGMGCGGPGALLAQLQKQLQSAKLQTGLLDDKPVIRIQGNVEQGQGIANGTAFPARLCRVYLDVNSLWPHRLEWHGESKNSRTSALLRIEFSEPDLGRELSGEECMRVFSYP